MPGSPMQSARPQMWVHVALATCVVGLLRAVPFVAVQVSDAPEGRAWLGIGYNAKDFLAYEAFIRQAAEGFGFLVDPYTTAPQDGRFLLLFHQLLGVVCGITGLEPLWVLELSRVPLLAALFVLVWRTAARVHPGHAGAPAAAVWLVGLASGVEPLVRRLLEGRTPELDRLLAGDLTTLNGWSGFTALHNPLWVAGLCLTLAVLGRALDPQPRARWPVAVLLVLLHWVHPYSAIVAIGALLTLPVVQMLFGGPWRESVRLAAPLVAAVTVLLPVSLWQMGDPVFREASGGVFGLNALSVFWYPATLGGLFFCAMAGWQRLVADGHPWRFALAAWTLAVVLLHTSPVINGYHFVFHLCLPVCLVAAPVVADVLSRRSTPPLRAVAGGLSVLLFAPALLVTADDVAENLRDGKVPSETLAIVGRLASEPPGRVLAPAAMGNLIPARTPHRVVVGQWFLTPRFDERLKELDGLVQGASVDAPRLARVVAAEDLTAVVLPQAFVPAALDALPGWRALPFERHALLLR